MEAKKFIISLSLFVCLLGQAVAREMVKVWEEPLTIPTYLVDVPDKNPMFFQHQSYQGASRVIYPYALSNFLKADEYPENQQIGRDENYDRNAQIYYYAGMAYEKLGEKKKAKQFYTAAAKAKGRNPEYLYYAAMAHSKLGKKEQSNELLNQVEKAAEEQLSRSGGADFFSKFGREQSDNLRKATAYFWLGLTETGHGNFENAKVQFQKAVELDPNHLWAKLLLTAPE